MTFTMFVILGLSTAFANSDSSYDRWTGENIITPISAPDMVLEAMDSDTSGEIRASIGIPADAANQKWIFINKGDGYYSIHHSHSPDLALTVKDGGMDNGTPVVLAPDHAFDWQLWYVKMNTNGTVSLIPKHAPNKGIDDFGGSDAPGSKLDIWDWNDQDEHLQWKITSSKNGMPTPIPRGKILQGEFNESHIYPGTMHRYWVYVPSQYDPTKPACVYVQQDGYGGFEARVFNQLIANHTMPVTVGVFVSPGYLPPPNGMDTIPRPNRCFEYDSLGDDYVRFITEELLPYIAKKEQLNLSKDGNDRCIGGGSSGGICAFNAAWERPDAFSRVYANSPSFVAFRGGNEFPTLVRKYEPKPIRIFMTCGTDDMENCAGDWTLIDLEMEKSLRFAGYDYEFHEIQGGHVVGWGPEQMSQAMTYLWRDWPNPVKAGLGGPRCQDILIPDEPWKLLADGFRNITGASSNSKGEVIFIDAGKNEIYYVQPGKKPIPLIHDAQHANTISVGAKDEIYTASKTTGKVFLYDSHMEPTLYADGVNAEYIIADPNGGIYASALDNVKNHNTIFLIKREQKTIVGTAGKFPAGMAITPDRWLLAAGDGHSKWIYSSQINEDGTLSNQERFFWLHVPDWEDDAGIGAICYDKEGHLYAATRLGIQICSDSGPTQVIIPAPSGTVTQICFGGSDMDILFAFCKDRIYTRKVRNHGLGAFTPWTKMTPGRL